MRRLIGYLLIGLLSVFMLAFAPSCNTGGDDDSQGLGGERSTAADDALADLEDE